MGRSGLAARVVRAERKGVVVFNSRFDSCRPAKIFLNAVALFSLVSCASPARVENAPQATATPKTAPTARPPATPPSIPENAERRSGAGGFEQYKFTYTKTGDQVVADFKSVKLPHTNQNVVVAAARELINVAYGERLENFPRLVAWEYREQKHGIKLEGEEYDYVFVPIKDADKDISQLIFWKVKKGTVD